MLVRNVAASRAQLAALAAGCLLLTLALAGAAAEKYALLGKPAPDLVARGLDGENVRVSEHRGEVVVVSFWSGSCSTCRRITGRAAWTRCTTCCCASAS